MVFSATTICYPTDIKDKEDENGLCPYLCAGNVFGKIEPLKEFFAAVEKMAKLDTSNKVKNEQRIVRTVRPQFSNLKADTNCQLFQTVLGFNYEYKDGLITIKK